MLKRTTNFTTRNNYYYCFGSFSFSIRMIPMVHSPCFIDGEIVLSVDRKIRTQIIYTQIRFFLNLYPGLICVEEILKQRGMFSIPSHPRTQTKRKFWQQVLQTYFNLCEHSCLCDLEQVPTTSYKEPNSKHLRLYQAHGLSCNSSELLLNLKAAIDGI